MLELVRIHVLSFAIILNLPVSITLWQPVIKITTHLCWRDVRHQPNLLWNPRLFFVHYHHHNHVSRWKFNRISTLYHFDSFLPVTLEIFRPCYNFCLYPVTKRHQRCFLQWTDVNRNLQPIIVWYATIKTHLTHSLFQENSNNLELSISITGIEVCQWGKWVWAHITKAYRYRSLFSRVSLVDMHSPTSSQSPMTEQNANIMQGHGQSKNSRRTVNLPPPPGR